MKDVHDQVKKALEKSALKYKEAKDKGRRDVQL